MSVVRISNRLPFPPSHVIEQQRQFGAAGVWPHVDEVGQVIRVQRHDVVELLKILGCHLPRAVLRDVDPFVQRDRDCAWVRRPADVPIARPGGVNPKIQLQPIGLPAQRCCRKRGAANIAEAYQKHRPAH